MSKQNKIVSNDAIQFEKNLWTQGGSFKRKPEVGWTHNDHDMTGGFGVAYSVIFCGLIEINKSLSASHEAKRTQVIREAILRVLHFAGIRPLAKKHKKAPKGLAEFLADTADTSLNYSEVNLIINSEKFLTSFENGKKLFSHGLNDVSFVATGVGPTADYIGYVSRDTTIPRACYVFDCLGNSQQIAVTMTQAFEIKLKQLLQRDRKDALLSTQGMDKGGWGEEPHYAEGAGSWNNASLPPVPNMFDDNIYEGINPNKDPLYDNKSGNADRGDEALYDNRPDAQQCGFTETGLYDNNVGGNLGRTEEATYDNRPSNPADDYMEGCLKQNIYDNNMRDKIADRAQDDALYDNNLSKGEPEVQDEFGSHPYDNVSKSSEAVEENVYESGDPVYDNKSGQSSDRQYSACIYDNNPTNGKDASPYSNFVDEGIPAFGESPYDNATEASGHAITQESDDGNYAKMESVRRTEPTGTGTELYDNIVGDGERREVKENIYDLADEITRGSMSTESSDQMRERGGTYDKLSNLYDLPPCQDSKTEALYDNSAPAQDARSLKRDLATELLYDNNRLLDPSKIEVLDGNSDEFETNPVYGAPEDALITSNVTFKSNGALVQPRKLSNNFSPTGFEDQAIYGEGLMMGSSDSAPSTSRILPAASLPFFHGLLSRKKCETLLKEEGDFLIRESESKRGHHVISGLFQGRCQHLLFMSEDGKIQTKDKEFPSISHLVAYYKKTKQILSTGSNNLYLKTPIIDSTFPESATYVEMK